MGHLLHGEQYLLDRRVIMRVSRLQQVWLILHLHATHIIFVIREDEFIIFINLSNQTRVLEGLPVPINVRFTTFEPQIQPPPRHFLAFLHIKIIINYYKL